MQPRHVFSRLMLLCIGLIAQPLLAAPPEDYQFLPFPQALQQAEAERKPVMLYFGRYGCSTCRKMHAEVFTDAELKQELATQFVLAYVDTESGKRIKLPNGERTTEMQFASRSRILGTPTFVYYSNEQKPLFRRAGFQSIEQMRRNNHIVLSGRLQKSALPHSLAAR